jgi:hypothetical protein
MSVTPTAGSSVVCQRDSISLLVLVYLVEHKQIYGAALGFQIYFLLEGIFLESCVFLCFFN